MARYDAVIVGGGVIGLCSAYSLAKAGLSVVVIDQGKMGHGSSLRNAGYLSPSHFVPLAAPGVFAQGLKWMLSPKSPFYIKPRLEPEFLRWVWNFSKSCNERHAMGSAPLLRDLLIKSQSLYQHMIHEEDMVLNLEARGLTVLFRSAKGRKACEHEAELASQLGVEAQMRSVAELSAADPDVEFAAEGGLYFPGDMHLRPELLIEKLTHWLEDRKIPLISNSKVLGFELKVGSQGQRVSHVKTLDQTLYADHFILASGAWSAQIARSLGLQMLLEAGKGYSITFGDPGKRPHSKPKRPYIFQERRVAVTPFSDGLRFAGTMEISGISDSINSHRVSAILEAIPYYFKNTRYDVKASEVIWSGMRPVTPDGLPYIGRYRQITNLIAATGHAMLGVSLGAVTGNVVKDLVLGRETGFDLHLLNPNRFD